MTTPAQTESQPQAYEPTTDQLARAAALRRFNRLAVYLPLGLAGLVVLALIGLLFWGVLSPNVAGTREFVSGLADVVIILAIMPLLLLCAVVPLAAVGLVIYRRQQPQREYGRLQPLFWRLDSILDRARNKAEAALPKAANNVISGHARITYWRTLINHLPNRSCGDKHGPG